MSWSPRASSDPASRQWFSASSLAEREIPWWESSTSQSHPRNHGLQTLAATVSLYKIWEAEEALNVSEMQPGKATLSGNLQVIWYQLLQKHFNEEGKERTAWEIYQPIRYPGLKQVAMKNIYETIEYGLNVWWYQRNCLRYNNCIVLILKSSLSARDTLKYIPIKWYVFLDLHGNDPWGGGSCRGIGWGILWS